MTDPRPSPDHDDLVRRLRTEGEAVRRARLQALERLDQANHASVRQLDTLERLRDDPARLWLLRQRARALASLRTLRHPLRALSSVGPRLFRALRLHRLGPAIEHVLYSTESLRGTPPVAQTADQATLAEAVRWLGGVTVHGVRRQALFLHPVSSITWEVPVPRDARLVISCALVPAVALQNQHGVVFRAQVTTPGAAAPLVAERLVRPATVYADRCWRSLTVEVPAADGSAKIVVSTHVPDGGTPGYAWAMIGEPRLLWRRSLSEMWRRGRAVARRDGWRGVFLRAVSGDTGAEAQADYRRWVASHLFTDADAEVLRGAIARLNAPPTFSVITPVHNTDPRWLRACIESVVVQIYPHWQLVLVDDASSRPETTATLTEYAARDPRITTVRLPQNGHISRASNAGLDRATGDYIALLDHDDELTPDALAEMALAIAADPGLDFLYSDEDKLDEAGSRCDPFFKPDWSPEMFFHFMYTNHLMVLRRRLVEAVGRFRVGYEGSQDFDLALRVIAQSSRIGHVPKSLYHWRKLAESTASDAGAKPWAFETGRRALADHVARTDPNSQVLDGAAPGLFRVKRPVVGQPLVSLVITTDDRSRDSQGRLIALLPHLVRSIVQKTTYANYELVIVDNGKLSDNTRDVLAGVPHRRVSYTITGAFNFAHKFNFAASHARGEHLVMLDDDIEVISSEWLTALLEYSQDPAVGAVGARLLYPDGRLQHVGMVLGVCGVAAHAFHQAAGHHHGYAGSAIGPRNYSAVTGACLMTRTEVFKQMGGLNERLAIDFNDVDFCLRVRQAGYRIVYTPYAELYHLESATISDRVRNPAETAYMNATWGAVIARDPYYNPNLTREFLDYRLP